VDLYADMTLGPMNRLEDSFSFMDSNSTEKPGKPSEKTQPGRGTKWLRFRNVFNKKDVQALQNHIIFHENFPIVAIVAVYMAFVYGTLLAFGLGSKAVVYFYYDWFSRLALTFAAIFIAIQLLKKSYKVYFTPRFLAGFLAIIVLFPLYNSAFVSFKQAIPLMHDFSFDNALMKLDYNLHFGHHPWRLLEPILGHPALLKAIDLLYILWIFLLFLFCLWMAWTRKRSLRLHFFISIVAIWSLLGSGLAVVFSSAGPCYFSKVVRVGDNPYAPLMSNLERISRDTYLWAVNNQVGLWQSRELNRWDPFGGVSAMPSIHLAIATLFALLAWRINKWLGALFVGYLIIMQTGSIILGWHYAVDGYVGIIIACLIWYAVGRWMATRAGLSQIEEGI
jgi:hypothetical protein